MAKKETEEESILKQDIEAVDRMKIELAIIESDASKLYYATRELKKLTKIISDKKKGKELLK